jgi:hypothetical protein
VAGERRVPAPAAEEEGAGVAGERRVPALSGDDRVPAALGPEEELRASVPSDDEGAPGERRVPAPRDEGVQAPSDPVGVRG